MAQGKQIQLVSMRMRVHPWLHSVGQGSVAVSCGVGCRGGLDSALLWLWRRLAAAALIRPLAWELPYAMGAALKRKKKKIYHFKHFYYTIEWQEIHSQCCAKTTPRAIFRVFSSSQGESLYPTQL